MCMKLCTPFRWSFTCPSWLGKCGFEIRKQGPASSPFKPKAMWLPTTKLFNENQPWPRKSFGFLNLLQGWPPKVTIEVL